MKRTEKVILTNMVMVYDDNGNVLVEDRVDPGWRGVAFPGGHVERVKPLPTPPFGRSMRKQGSPFGAYSSAVSRIGTPRRGCATWCSSIRPVIFRGS